MSDKHAIPAATIEELRAAATALHYNMNDNELALYGEFMAGLISDFN